MSSGLSQLSESTLASPTIKKKGIKKRLVKLFSRSEGNLKEKYHTASDGDNCFTEDVSMSTVEEGHLVKKGRSSWSEKRGKKERSDAENERQGWGHSLPRLRYHRAEDSMSRSSKRASKTRSLSSSEMNLPAPGFLQRFGSLTWRKKKPSVLDGSGLASPESTLVDTHWSLGQLNRPVDSVSDLKDERPKSCYVEALFTESALESSDFCPKDNQNIQKNLEISATFDCLADSTVSYCSSEEDAGDKITQLQSFMSSNEKEENEQVVLPFWAQSILKEYMPEYHKPQPSPVLKKQEEGEEDKCLHGELTYNTSQVTMTEEQINSAPHSPSQSEKSLEPYQYSQTHPKCPSSENEEQDTPQLNPPYPAVQEEALAQNVTESQATPGPHKVRYEIIITMKKEGQMDETDVPELGGAMSIGEELVGPDLNLSPSLECQACGHHRAGTTALTAHAHTEQPKNYTNLEDEKISELRGGETCVRAHLDRDISLAGDEQQDLLVCEQTPEHYRSQSPNMEKKCSLDNEHSHSPGRAQPSRMVLSNNEVSRVPTNRDRNSYVGHVMDMRKVFESNGSKEDFIHNLKSVKPNSYSSVREKYTVTQNELGDLHKPIYSQVFKPPKPSLDRKGCNELFPHLARKDSVNAAQAWESSKEMNSRSVLEKDMIHLRDRDVKVKETKHKHTILPLKDLHVHPRTPTPPPDKSRTMSVFLTSPKGWRKESLRSLSPRLLHEQTDGNMDCAKPVLNKSPDKFTFTYNKDGYQNYGTDSFSAKPVEKASRKVYKGTAKEINNNVLITNPLITSKEQSENSYKMTILQDESDLNNIGESSTDRNLTLESNTLTAIYKLSERQLRDTGTREEVMLQLAEQERPMQDPAIISWEQTESPDDQSVFTKSNTIIRGESDDYYEQSNFFGTVESHITENYKVMDNPVTSDNMINMNYLTSEQPIFLDYTIPFVTTNVYKGATQDASQHCHIAESNTESVTRRNYINPPGEIITGTAVSGNTFGKTQTRSFIWDFPEYSGQWPTSMVLENIHTDYMNDNSYNGWHKAKAQMVYTSTEDESEQKEQDKPISEVKGYRTVNKTEQSSESGENRNQANDGIAADKIGLDLGSTNQQKADNESTKQEHTKQSYDSGIHEGDLQVVVQHSVGLSEDKARISNASQNVDKTFSVVTNDKPVCTILPVGNDIENVPCLTQNALVPSKETSQKQSTIQQKELTHIHHDGIIDINPVNKEIYNHMKDEEKTHQAREMLFHILSKEISVEHVYDFREKDLEKCMANDNIDIIDLAPSMEDQADNMSDLLDVHQAGDMLVYLDTKEALVEQDNDQADFLQKPEELVGQTYDAIDIVTCVTQDSLVFAPSIEECLQQATSQPSKKFIHMHTIVEKDIMSEKEDQADSNINMNDEDKTHRVSELLFHIPSKEISVEHAYYQGERNLEKIEVANDNIDIVYITPSVENETENMSGSLAVGEAGDVLGYTYTKEASVEQDNHQAITDRLQKFEQLVDQTDNATDILTLEKETDENISKGEGDDKTDQMFDYICSAGVSEEHAFIQSKDYLIRKPKDVIDPPVIVIDESLEENQVENMRGSLAVDVAGDVLVYISTKEASVEQYNHKAITDRLQKLEQLVDQTDNATDILTLTKETDENIRWEVDDNKDQMFDYICSVNVSEEHGFIQSKEYLIQKPMDVIDPNVNVIDECLEENPEENDSGLEDEDTVDIQSYRLMTGKSVENTNEKPSSEKPVVQENHYASLTDSSSKDIQAEHIINLTAEDIKGHSNNSQNVIFFASFNEASVEHNKYKPVAINQGENVLNQSNGIISILPTDELHKQVEFITMDPKVERHSENSLLANKNDIQAIVDKYRSDYVTDDRNLLIQEAQKVENRNPTSSTGFHSHSGQISSEISSKVCQESVQDADTQASGHSIIEDKGCPDVLEPSMQKVLTNLSEQSVQLVQGSHVSNTVNVRNDITTEYTGDRYNLQIEEESSKDMEMWINTLRHLESHSGQISSEITSKVCQESVQDADTQTTGQSNTEDKGSTDVLEPSVQKLLTNLSEQSVQFVQGSQAYNMVHVRNDITKEYTGDQYNLQSEEESSKDMAMWINTLRHLEIPEFMKYQRVPRQPRHSALSMYATLPPIKEDVCSPNSDHIDSDSLPQEKNDDLEISQDTKPILNLEHNEKKYSWEKDFEKPIQISPLEMMRKHSGEEVERTTSHKSSLTQNLSQRQESIIGSLLLSERQERKNEQNEGKSFSRLKSSLLLSSYIKPKKEPLSVNGEEEEILSDSVHTEAGSTQPNVVVPRIPESPKHPVTGTDTPPKHTVDSVPPLVSKELPCKSNLRIVSQFKASTDIWHHTKKEHGKVNPRPGKVLLFSDLGFNGKCYEINGNVSDTSEWELQETISIRVIRGGWILYEEPRFHGRRVMLLEGDAELKCPWLEHTDSNREPQTTSAFWVGSLRHVVRDFRVPKISLFLQPNGEGEKVQIEGAAPDMSEYGGTIKTESIIVHCGMWLVFSKPLYQGDPYILEPGGYPNRRSWGAEDPQVCSLEAARIGGPIVEKPNEPKLLLFQMPEFEGTCLEVTRDMNSIQGEHNLQGEKLYSVGSLKVVGGCWVGYEKEGFRGHQYLLEEGDFNDFSDWGGCTEELGSVRLIRTDFSQPEIVLYELPGCLEGPCLRLSESLADLEEAQYGTRTGSIHVLSGVWVAYENVDFSGEQYILEKGVYHNYQDWGAENGKISSVQPVIQVGGNSLHFLAKIHMFSEPNFYGDCLTCIGGHMELPESFSLQSCRVECGSWSLYEGENQSGEQYILSEGEYPTRTAMGCLTPCPLRSLKMVPLYFSIPSLSLHGLERFEGKELDFTEEVRSLQGEGYNNHVMSVSVKSGIWVVYEHSDFRGRQWLLERKQIPNWLLYSGLQRIGSLCPIRQRTVYFRLRNRNLGLFLCVAELTEDMKAARVLVTEPQDGRCLLWYYEEGRLKNQMAPHMNLQVIGQSSSGTKVVLWSESRKPIQTWNLEDSGCITSCLFKGMCLDVKGGQCYDSDHVIIWETTEDRLTQQWDLEVF